METTTLACANCGATDDFAAWYDQPERQSIALDGTDEAGRVKYDYTGCTDSGDAPGDDYGFMCGQCATYSESLEELVGLPKVAGGSTLAALFAEGQHIFELDADDFRDLVELVAEDEQRRRGDAGISDVDALNELAKYLHETPDWNGGDFCELAATLITRTGREA